MSCKADQVAELVRDMQVNVAKYGRENTTTYLMVRAINELQRLHKPLDRAALLAASTTAQPASGGAAPVAEGDALPTIKGATITGGYVVVTPAGWGDDKAPAVRDAILRLFPVNPAFTPRPQPCHDCGGTGVDGDADHRGNTIDVPCGACDGSGRAKAKEGGSST